MDLLAVQQILYMPDFKKIIYAGFGKEMKYGTIERNFRGKLAGY